MTWVTSNQTPPPEEDPESNAQGPTPPDATESFPAQTEAFPASEAGIPDDFPAQPPPSEAVRFAQADDIPTSRRLAGLGVLIVAAALTFVALLLVFLPNEGEPLPPSPVVPPTQSVSQPTVTQDDAPVDSTPVIGNGSDASGQLTLSPEEIAMLLSTPPVEVGAASGAIPRENDPFTILPERARNEVITYEVQSGDTMSGLAEDFGLEMDSIGWCNDRDTIFALRPGAELLIPPVDGVCHRILVPESIQEIADRYQVEDVYTVINSEFNNLFSMTPQTLLQSGDTVFVAGGVSSYIDWQYNPMVERTGGGGGDSGGGYISFAPSEPGSCGSQANPGHAGFGANPMSSYSWSRGFSSFHTGVDLASSVGAPIFAAASGRVIYAGWNNWGYGNLIVVAHGPFTTFYAHLNTINVGCGQMVSAGQQIAGLGNTGNSSGPHLHFEIRYNDIATDPLLYFAF